MAARKGVPAKPRVADDNRELAVDVLVDLLRQIRTDERLGRAGRDAEEERLDEQTLLHVAAGTYAQDDYVVDDEKFDIADRRLVSAAVAERILARRRRRLAREASQAQRAEQGESSSTTTTSGAKRRPKDPVQQQQPAPKRPRSTRMLTNVSTETLTTTDTEEDGTEDGDELQEITLGSLIEQLRRPESLLRLLFVRTLVANFEAWMAKMLEVQAGIASRRQNDPNSMSSSSPTTQRTTPSDSSTSASSSHSNTSSEGRRPKGDDDDIKQQEEHDDEILWQRTTRFTAVLSGELTQLKAYLNRSARTTNSDSVRGLVESYAKQAIDAMQRLNSLVGLVSLKDNVAVLLLTTWLSSSDNATEKLFGDHRNILLYGDPGSGKTQSATLLREILYAIGVLIDVPGGTLHAFGRSELVAAYSGQTSIKFRRAFVENWGGMMFIDEFYALNSGSGSDEFGEEGINALVKLTEDFKGQVLVVGAGYKRLIQQRILDVNEGVNSRFPYKWTLPNYSAPQLYRILLDTFRVDNLRLDKGTTAASTQLPPPPPPPPQAPLSLPAPPSAASQRRLDTNNAEEILRDLTQRAEKSGFFKSQNARGARALTIAINTQRQRRSFVRLLPLNANARFNENEAVTAVDVYRGFASWVQQSQDAHVVYLDERVDALVGELD